jgi:septum site-determining protein MinD
LKRDGAASLAVLAVTSGKGGVGKTTTALGLAGAAARAGDRPVVVDADRDCPDLATMAGTDGGGLARFADGAPVDVAGTRIDGATVLGARFDDDALAAALERLTDAGRPVLLDCPAGAGAPVAAPLRAAERSLVVVRRTERALVDGRKAATLARRLDAAPVGVVVSRAERVDGVGAVFDAPVLDAVPETARERPWRAETPYEALYRAYERRNA